MEEHADMGKLMETFSKLAVTNASKTNIGS
jgi:hypothetical protein